MKIYWIPFKRFGFLSKPSFLFGVIHNTNFFSLNRKLSTFLDALVDTVCLILLKL